MFRADQAICGTSTTGTGTLTLAATPVAPGGIDLDVWARATGFGFGNSAAIPVSYTILEYTSTAFSTVKSFEKGIGTLTLGSSSGIANATLSRDIPQATGTSLNSQPATASAASPSAISIGTAANTLVFIGASSMEIPAFDPYVFTGNDNIGTGPFLPYNIGGSGAPLTSGNNYYTPFTWTVPGLYKRITTYCTVAYSGGTSDCYARIYANNSSCQPGKLLYDFGDMGTPGSSLATAFVNVASGASGNGVFLSAGCYWLCITAVYSGGSGTPRLQGNSFVLTGFGLGSSGFYPIVSGVSTGGSSTAADPAGLTSYTGASNGAGTMTSIQFNLKGS